MLRCLVKQIIVMVSSPLVLRLLAWIDTIYHACGLVCCVQQDMCAARKVECRRNALAASDFLRR